MPCRPWEEPSQHPEPNLKHPATPTDASCKDGASHAYPDAKDPATQSGVEEELAPSAMTVTLHNQSTGQQVPGFSEMLP
jgi:hypothetical protein